jgi:hypothetical protein
MENLAIEMEAFLDIAILFLNLPFPIYGILEKAALLLSEREYNMV